MEYTPPLSPSPDQSDSVGVVQEKGALGFHCLGDISKREPFDHNGFVCNGDGNLAQVMSNVRKLKSCFVTVYGQTYDIDSAAAETLERLFLITRNRICFIDSCLKVNKGLPTVVPNRENLDLENVRQELREFFCMLQILISVQSNRDYSLWVLNELCPIISKGLTLIRSLLGWLIDLPSYVLNYTQTISSTKATALTAFHCYHCHLELRWMHLSVLWMLSVCMSATPKLPEASQFVEVHSNSDCNVQSAIQMCMADLVQMAVSNFNKLQLEQLAQTSLFNCKCVKEFWLLLRCLTEDSFNGSKSFWKLVDGFFDILVKTTSAINIRKKPLVFPTQIGCSDPTLFSLWFLKSIGELFMFAADGNLCTSLEYDMDAGQPTLRRVFQDLSGDTDMGEVRRRVLVSLVNRLMTAPWRPKPEAVMMLWDKFCRNLDSSFQLPGALPTSYSIANETVQEILESVHNILEKESKVNSFDRFLALTARYLKQDPNQWKSKMSGRFFSKLSEKKVDALSEVGLYHLTQLFLTIAVQTELDDLAVKFQKLVRFIDGNEKRNEMVMKAQLCFAYLFAKEGKSVMPVLRPLIEKLDSFISIKQITVVKVFVFNLQYIVNCNESLLPDLYVICDNWIDNFLKYNQDSARTLLNFMVNIMDRIKLYLASSNVDAGVEKLIVRLREFLLPFVKQTKHTSTEQVADLAAGFTITALMFSVSGNDSFTFLLHHFLMSESSHVLFVKRYLFHVLTCNKIRDTLEGNEHQQISCIKAWIRCCALSGYSDESHEDTIVKEIFMMPLIKNVVKPPLKTINKDPLVCFVESFGCLSQSPIEHRKLFLSLIEPLKLLIPTLKSLLFPSKPRDGGSWKTEKAAVHALSNDIIIRAFYIYGKLIFDCGTFIFEKNTSPNFLTTLISTLILNPVVLDFTNRLPTAIDEGLRKHLLLYIRGLHRLGPQKEKCIQRYLVDIIKVYVPRFIVTPQNDPFIKIWDDPEHMECAVYIIGAVCSKLLQVDFQRNNTPHQFYKQALLLINGLIRRNECDEVLLRVVINEVFPNCLRVVGKVTDPSFVKTVRELTTETFELLFKSEAYLTNPNLWDETTNTLNKLSNENLSFSAEIFMRMLNFLVEEFQIIVKRFLPTLSDNIKEVNSKRGSGKDSTLEWHFSKLRAQILPTDV